MTEHVSKKGREMILDHTVEVANLSVLGASQIVTLVVGPWKLRIPCLKVLLGYYSGFFHGAFYGGFPQSSQDEIILPEEISDVMEILVIGNLRIFGRIPSPRRSSCVIFDNTAPNYKLRLFVKDLIAVEGPFNESNAQLYGKDFKEEWLLTLAKGGGPVKECVQTGLSNFVDGSKPYDPNKRRKYYQEVDKSSPEE
ncbi:hypothetical protein B0J14DRAFT_695503 [Halenospora varia]|nr:hypothetical protein B0J14DRAFT_695503 [Halenospora varia]